jgi:hypothetical protein
MELLAFVWPIVFWGFVIWVVLRALSARQRREEIERRAHRNDLDDLLRRGTRRPRDE